MPYESAPLGYYVAFFDVLGFESRLAAIGLEEMHEKYEQLVELVELNNSHHDALEKKTGMMEGYIRARDGLMFWYKVNAAYASDSFIVWANRCWKSEREKSEEELKELAKHPALGWLGTPIPPDIFLNLCSALVCRSVEIGLPLRGSLSAGKAVIDKPRGIFLGQPFVDAVRFEKTQVFIGATLHESFHNQEILANAVLPYRSQFKQGRKAKIFKWCLKHSMSAALDWPRVWRSSREVSLIDTVKGLDNGKYSEYYRRTLDFIEFSESNADYWKNETSNEGFKYG